MKGALHRESAPNPAPPPRACVPICTMMGPNEGDAEFSALEVAQRDSPQLGLQSQAAWFLILAV